MKTHSRQFGFTLTELMIVVAIMGILAAIAIPNYQNYVRKSKRSGAQTLMLNAMTKQEQYLLQNRAYATTLAELNITVPADVSPNYTFAITTAATPPSYTITATAIGGQVPDGDLSLTNAGVKTPADKW